MERAFAAQMLAEDTLVDPSKFANTEDNLRSYWFAKLMNTSLAESNSFSSPSADGNSVDASAEDCRSKASSASSAAERTGKMLTVVLLLASVYLMMPTSADPDLWGHVQYGRDLLQEGLPRTTTYSFTAEGYPWINHENLAEVVYAVLADWTGVVGLQTFRLLIAAGIILSLAMMLLRRKIDGLVVGGFCFLISLNLMYHWSPRPQLFSYGLFALMLGLLHRAYGGWAGRWHLPWLHKLARCDLATNATREDQTNDSRAERLSWLWLAVPMFIIWTNSHGGFLAGLLVFWSIGGLRVLEHFISKRSGSDRSLAIRQILLPSFAVGIATLVNPYSWRLHAWLIESLGTPRPEIVEWHGLAWSSPQAWLFGLLVGVLIVVYRYSDRQLDLTRMIVLLLLAWQAASHQRHIAFFAIAAGYWSVDHVASAAVNLKEMLRSRFSSSQSEPHESPLFVWLLRLCIVGIAFGMFWRVTHMPVSRQTYPVSALEFMAENGLDGRVVVTYNWAQYLIAAGVDGNDPRFQVAFDGRFRTCYPQEIVDMHFDFVLGNLPGARCRSEQSPPIIDGRRVLEHGSPDLVLLSRDQGHSEHVMRDLLINHPAGADEKWTLLYQDNIAQVWGRSAKYDQVGGVDYLSPDRRVVLHAQSTTRPAAWPAIPEFRPRQAKLASGH